MAKPTPLFSFTCPSCGGPGEAYSATSVLVVCEYCHSMLERTGGGLEGTGKKSVLLEDFSPVQLYTTGTYQGVPFTVIGVLQIKYDRGLWKEWYILFADGTYGWLGDFSGQYVITREIAKPSSLPTFESIKAGQTLVSLKNASFVACDVRQAKSLKTYARGELPFTLQADETVVAADFRYRDHFLTLDYSENDKEPRVYQGKMVDLKNLRCEFLRADEEIKATAGRLKGDRESLNCPQCGAPLVWYAGAASNIICQSCHTHVNLDSGIADVTRIHKRRLAQQEISTLKLGEEARINGQKWTIIGMVRMHELSPMGALNYVKKLSNSCKGSYESSYWHEYLLYNMQKGFLWLVESSDGNWDLVHTPHTWPEIKGSQCIDPGTKKTLRRLYDYGGEVIYAAGAFYWDLEPGDISYYQDFRIDNGKFSAEMTRDEFSWSLSKPVSPKELAKWFKRPELEKIIAEKSDDGSSEKKLGTIFFCIYVIINLPIFFAGNIELFFVVSCVVFWLVLGKNPASNNDDDD